MVQHHIYNDAKVVPCLVPKDYATTPALGDVAVDTAGFTDVTFICACGNITGTVDFAVFMDTVTGGSYSTAVTGASSTQFSASDDNKVTRIHITLDPSRAGQTRSRFMKVKVTPVGGSANLASAVAVLQGHTGDQPISNAVTALHKAGASV
jgi:hypothetical protein